MSPPPRQLRIAFDLDGTLVPDGRRLEPGLERPSIPVQWIFRERLRAGTPALLRDLHREGHELWIYTTSLRSETYIRWWFRMAGAPIRGVVNHDRHRWRISALGLGRPPSKHPPSFGIDLLIDDSAGVAAEGREHGFHVVEIDPRDADWASNVRVAVSELSMNTDG